VPAFTVFSGTKGPKQPDHVTWDNWSSAFEDAHMLAGGIEATGSDGKRGYVGCPSDKSLGGS